MWPRIEWYYESARRIVRGGLLQVSKEDFEVGNGINLSNPWGRRRRRRRRRKKSVLDYCMEEHRNIFLLFIKYITTITRSQQTVRKINYQKAIKNEWIEFNLFLWGVLTEATYICISSACHLKTSNFLIWFTVVATAEVEECMEF
jgi:hypothetical protein